MRIHAHTPTVRMCGALHRQACKSCYRQARLHSPGAAALVVHAPYTGAVHHFPVHTLSTRSITRPTLASLAYIISWPVTPRVFSLFFCPVSAHSHALRPWPRRRVHTRCASKQARFGRASDCAYLRQVGQSRRAHIYQATCLPLRAFASAIRPSTTRCPAIGCDQGEF